MEKQNGMNQQQSNHGSQNSKQHEHEKQQKNAAINRQKNSER